MENLKSKKITFVDIGTHKGIELLSLFSLRHPIKLLLMSLAGAILKPIMYFDLKKINLDKIKKNYDLCLSCIKVKKLRNRFHLIAVEPNYRLFNCKVYSIIDELFPIAISEAGAPNVELRKLFHANNDIYSQGSSIYENKGNININHFYHVNCISPEFFANEVNKLTTTQDNPIILRINCEGSEDGLIHEFIKIFGKRILCILGSLDDVGKIKGIKAQNSLLKYIESNNIKFIPFIEDPSTWTDSHKEILSHLS